MQIWQCVAVLCSATHFVLVWSHSCRCLPCRFYCVDSDARAIKRLKRTYAKQKQWSFEAMDVSSDLLPKADMLLSRGIAEVRLTLAP